MLKTLFVVVILLAVALAAGTGYVIYDNFSQAVIDPGFPCPLAVSCETLAGRAVSTHTVGFVFALLTAIGFTITAFVTQGRAME